MKSVPLLVADMSRIDGIRINICRKETEYMNKNDTSMTMRITLAEAFDIYLSDEVFQEYIDSGCFVYNGFGFFTRIQLRAANIPHGLVFESARGDKKTFKDTPENREALERTQKFIEHFNVDFEKEKKLAQNANSKLLQFMENEHWNSVVFQEKTLLSAADYSRLKDPEHRFGIRAYTAMAVGLKLSVSAYLDVLSLAGLGIRRDNKEEMAYLFLIASMRGESINRQNDFLVQQGFKPLGTIPNK